MPEEKNKKSKRKLKNPFIVWFPDSDVKKEKLQEALSIRARRKLAQRMIRMARQMAVARKKARARFASNKNLKIRGQKLARSIFRKRLTGKRGQDYSNLGMADKVALDKMVDKQAPAIKKMVKRLMPAVRRAEADRLRSARTASSNKQDQRHKKKFHGAKHEPSR